jgi:hypothetical protein
MREDIKNKWVYHLKSGNYKKATGKLRKVAKNGTCTYCALGVLTDLYINANSDTCKWDREIPIINGDVYGNGVLPKPVAVWAELKHTNGAINGRNTDIPGLNDTGKSFEYIATVIETEGLV